jgi:hypothetical protein
MQFGCARYVDETRQGKKMSEWVLIVWMLIPGGVIADPIEIGTYRMQARCEAARDTVKAGAGVTTIALCVERDK